MSGTEIRQLEAANGAEYQALFLEAFAVVSLPAVGQLVHRLAERLTVHSGEDLLR